MDSISTDWRREISGRIRSVEALEEHIRLDPAEKEDIRRAEEEFAWHITPYYAGLMSPTDPHCPIRRQAVPSAEELEDPLGNMDPLLEEEHNPAPNIIKVYPDRIAWTVSGRKTFTQPKS